MKCLNALFGGLLCAGLLFSSCGGQKSLNPQDFPVDYSQFVASISADSLGGHGYTCNVEQISQDIVKVNLHFDLKGQSVQQDDWQVRIKPAFTPTFNWAPHLTPADSNIVAQHVFRSPALIVTDGTKGFAVIPDLDVLAKAGKNQWYMDMNAEDNVLTLGMSLSTVCDHVLYARRPGAEYTGKVDYGFYIVKYDDKEDVDNPFRAPLEFMWERWGHERYAGLLPLNLEPYVKHTYNWAFNTWVKNVWQEFELNGKTVGAPVFIVNTTQSPNYPGEVNEREFRSIWNQAWFSSLRSASGLFRYARRTSNQELMQKAMLTKELALAAPMKKGFFYTVIGTDMENVEIDGKLYNRSKGWDHYYWGNSNRNPYTWDAKKSPFHVLDMSWTALLMLRWYDELEKDERLLKYAETYAEALLGVQYDNGCFPGWLDLETLEPMEYLNNAPETSLSVTFLLKLYELTNKEAYKTAALKAMKAMESIICEGRWEDFETYWSCCRVGTPAFVGKKVARNNMYKQCNFSEFWTAEALLECYRVTGEAAYLQLGRRVLDEMLMTQASWQPPYIYVNGIGGFGVMNCDGEWNDSRGSLFAELILQYGKELQVPEYTERGLCALKTSFEMMYCPENPKAKEQWEKVWPFFNEKDYGFTMENYGHGGATSPEGEGMGEFTIYDWGNGAASEAYNRILDKFGKEVFE